MKRILFPLAIVAMLSIAAVFGQPLIREYGLDGTDQVSPSNPLPTQLPALPLSQGTSTNVTVTTSAQTVSLNGYSQQVTINNTSASNTVYFQPFGGAASTANFPIAPNQYITWSCATVGQPRGGINQFSLYASGSGTVVGVLAH